MHHALFVRILQRVGHLLGVAVDSAGNLFIADYFNARIRKVSLDGPLARRRRSAPKPGLEPSCFRGASIEYGAVYYFHRPPECSGSCERLF